MSESKEAEKGLIFNRNFWKANDVNWVPRDAVITNMKGDTVFEQKNVMFPDFWSDMAVKITASKYFHGKLGTRERETSLEDLVSRVVNKITDAGAKAGYFASQESKKNFSLDLTWLLTHQWVSFNSPVWFNVGCDFIDQTSTAKNWHWNAKTKSVEYSEVGYTRPQASACFINSVEDSMESILDLAKTEGMLFKWGSGTGTNLSVIRSSKEKLAGGGVASGPVSFMRGYDAFAGVIKSGGKTRRAAKMVILNADHPDIEEFIECKGKEEAKAHALMREGYDGTSGPESEAYMSIFFQNANNSVRVSDEFMVKALEGPGVKNWELKAVKSEETLETVSAYDLLWKISEQTWACGDPGLQYDDTINRWHTCKNTDRIHASNPCCFVGETEIDTSEGRIRIDWLEQMARGSQPLPRTFAWDLNTNLPALKQIERVWIAGQTSNLVKVTTDKGITVTCTPEHRFLTFSGDYVEAQYLQPGTRLRKIGRFINEQRGVGRVRGLDWPAFESWINEQRDLVNDKIVSVEVINLDEPVNVYDMQVAETNNFAVTSGDAVHSIIVHNSEYKFLNDSACNLASFNLLKFLKPDGEFDILRFQRAVRIMITAMDILVDLAGYPTEKIAKNSHDYRPLGLGYANLGALLMEKGLAYDSDEGRDYAAAITSLLGGASYLASAELAEKGCQLDPANGNLKTSYKAFPGFWINEKEMLKVIQDHANAADQLYDRLSSNRASESKDIAFLANTIWNDAASLGYSHGFRNAQVTVLAPTGTIGFMMDCDTTGVEPMLGLVVMKKMVGGGYAQLANPVVERALRKLGYKEDEIQAIRTHIEKTGTVVGSPFSLVDEHLPIFDGAFAPAGGGRSIHYIGHIKMMAAVQPFLSGAISKTVNLPEYATVKDIFDAYVESWKLGIKAVAIYRDGSKKNQVMVTSKEEKKEDQVISGLVSHQALIPILEHVEPGELPQEAKELMMKLLGTLDLPREKVEAPKAVRRKLEDTRSSVTHKFSIANHEGYLTVGLYPDGSVGEIFITMAKEGSTLSGVMDAFATAVSIGLQYGVPLQTLIEKFAHSRFEPSGWTHSEKIGFAKSIVDYIFRWLKMNFVDDQLIPNRGPIRITSVQWEAVSSTKPEVNIVLDNQAIDEHVAETMEQKKEVFTAANALATVMDFGDSPSCGECGAIMVRNAACYRCMECGGSSGCS